MNTKLENLYEVLTKHCRPATAPVAVKLAQDEDTAMEKTRYPLEQVGHRLAVCQGMTLARTFGWTMGFRKDDHACPLPRVFMGHTRPDKFLEGTAAGFYQDDEACMRIMEASYPRWPVAAFREIWLSPANKCEFTPDLIVAYASPAQILALIQGANYGLGSGIESTSTGRYGCATWIAGAVQSGKCTYMIPGPGERIFAGTQDHEMSFAIPYARIDQVIDGLKYISRLGAYKYPVPNLGVLAEPKLPAKYYEVDADA